ncbi:MAG: M1 family aminopeptidase [Candidatus Edwardsbacteria bacterium]|nr:M1 family aminopeptidase [Candidatus Edwardsbacteria bacterium]
MKRILMLVMLALAAPLAASASDLETRPPVYNYSLDPGGAKFDTTLDYFIDDYKLYLNLPMYNDSLYGRSSVSMCTNVGGAVTVTFNYGDLVIDSVMDMDGFPCDYDTGAGVMNINVSFKTPSCFVVNIYYRGGGFAKGYHHFLQGGSQLHTMAYTMSEPQDARYWMPCMDEPWFKTTQGCSFYITVPDSYKVASNGILVDTVRSGDSLTWHWQEDRPIATYLMSFAVSNYAFWSDTAYTSIGDTIPLNYFVWPEDSLQAALVFDSVSVMLECLTQKFGHYPFQKYGMAAAYPFGFGGMEHQDMTTINRSWVTGNSQRGILHELAHMWWGDQVTCGYWSDIWLNEGFASYSEAIYDEYKNANQPGIYMMQTFTKALNATGYAIYNPPPESLFASSMVYAKGAWVLQGLRWVMGDAPFFETLAAYRDSFSYGNAVTSDFQRIAEQHYGDSLNWFFDQWVYRAGHPIYSTIIYYKTHDDSNSAWVNLKHTSNTGELYMMPLALACSTGVGPDSTIVVWDSLAVQDILVNDDQPILKIKLDPDSWVLKEWEDYLPEMSSLTTNGSKYGGSLIDVYWHDFWVDTACAGYNLYRAENMAGPFSRVNQDIISDTSYSDTTTYDDTEYYYAVTAVSSIDTCYETHLSGVLSCVAGVAGGRPDGGPVVTDFRLYQNAPNPFTGQTAINYQIPKPGTVSLKIYNIAGQHVKTLADGTQPAGRYTARWDGRDNKGQKVASGLYIYCLNTGDRSFVKKMQYIR